jgi:hypothetical protein
VRLTDAYIPPCATLAVVSSRLNSDFLATCMVLAHPRATFHPCTCGLRKGTVAVSVVFIGYDDVEDAIGMTTRSR